MRSLLLALLAVPAFVACSASQGSLEDPSQEETAPVEAPAPASSSTSKSSGAVAAVVTPSTPTAPTSTAAAPPAPDVTWTGTLATTDTVAYGGGNACNYKGHFETVKVTVVVNAAGEIKSSDVKGEFIEEVVGTCPYTTIPKNAHDYAFAPTTPASVTFKTPSADGDQPHAMMTATVSTGTDAHITLSWTRDDIGAPFNWTITSDVTLTKE